MIGRKLPVFQKGKILTKEMLQALTDFTISASETAYLDYANGILYGCKLTTTYEVITIHPGAVVLEGIVYYITEEISLPYAKSNQWMVLKVRHSGESVTENFEVKELEFALEPENLLSEKEIELCRFKLQPGARLRTTYRDFADLETEFDTLHYRHACWAAYGSSSLSSVILRMFYEEAVQKENIPEKYLQFCMQIAQMKQETLNNQTISLFISSVLERPYKILKQEEMYQGLKEALEQMKSGRSALKQRAFPARKMIVE